MSNLDYRLGTLATMSAVISVFLFVVDVGETPLVFENERAELLFIMPLLLWAAGRRLHLWHRTRP